MMTPEQIEQVFGRARLKMATGEHVEVFREAMLPGERRRYTKRFLATSAGDFGPWTAREWRILARLIGHGVRCVPDVVQFDGGAQGGARLVQTYDAGITVDQWGTLLPVARGRQRHPHIFEDCAHWWSLARHCLVALDEIHALGLVHLDIKGDNICIPYGPSDFDPAAAQSRLYPEFGRLALIDFAFALVSRESLAMPLPIGWQKDYDYQSPRLLRALDAGRNGDLEPTKELDWRCDLYSLAAMLKRYLPAAGRAHEHNSETGWSSQRYDDARTLILRLRESHDRDLPQRRPHSQFIDYTSERLSARDLAASLADGWPLARDTIAAGLATPLTPITPMTRLAPPIRAPGRPSPAMLAAPPAITDEPMRMSGSGWSESSPTWSPTAVTAVIAINRPPMRRLEAQLAARKAARRLSKRALPISVALASLVTIAAPSFVGDPEHPLARTARELMEAFTAPTEQATQDVVRRGEPSPHAALTAPETLADASAADQRSAEPASDDALSIPADSQKRPENAASSDSAQSAPAHPVAESIAAGPQSESDSAGLLKSRAAEPALPQGNEPNATTGSTISRAPATSPTSDAPAPGVSSQAQLKKHRTPASRAQPKSSSKDAAKPADGPGRAYAGASRHSAAHPAGAHARMPEPTRRLDLAAVTPALSRPAQATPTPPPPAGPLHETVPRNADASTILESGTSQDGQQRAAVSAPPDAASGTTTISSGAGPASAEPSVARTETTPRRSVQRAKPREDWRTQLAGLFGILRDRTGPAAPVEDRMAQTSANGRAAASRSQAPSTTAALPRATPVASTATTATPTQGAAVASPITAPITIEPPTPAPSPPAITTPLNYADARSQPRSFVDATARVPLQLEVRRPPLAETPSPTRRVAVPPHASRDEQDLTAQARRLLAETVPRVASLAEPEMSRVLSTAAIASRPAQSRLVIEAADGPWPSESAWIPVGEAQPAYARRLHEQARRALASGGDVTEALDVELQAFGANPRDPDIAGYLAYLYLRTNPARPETARQLALHSIVLSGSRRSTRRAEWNTLAVASALTGRDVDAVRVFLAEAALTANVDRSCQAALRAYASYGEVLRAPVLAFFQRVSEQGRAYDAPSCMRSAYWNVATRASNSY